MSRVCSLVEVEGHEARAGSAGRHGYRTTHSIRKLKKLGIELVLRVRTPSRTLCIAYCYYSNSSSSQTAALHRLREGRNSLNSPFAQFTTSDVGHTTIARLAVGPFPVMPCFSTVYSSATDCEEKQRQRVFVCQVSARENATTTPVCQRMNIN